MTVSFVIPLYNGLAFTQAMLATLRETLPRDEASEIIFVDDGSTDGTRAWLAGLAAPDVRVLLNERNLGYAGANNRGAAAARGEWLALLNNDLLLAPGWLEPLLAVGRRLGPRAGLIGNVQRRVADGAIDHAGIVATPRGKLAHVRTLPAAGQPDWAEVLAVTAACCLVRREVFLAAGGFDPAFHNGGEDVDLALRLRAAGRPSVVVFNSVIQHHVSASRGPTSRQDEANSRLLFTRWPAVLAHEIGLAWDRELAARTAAVPAVPAATARLRWRVTWADRLARAGQRLGLWPRPSATARLLAASALAREESRWRLLLAGAAPPPDDVAAYQVQRLHPGENGRLVWIDRHARVRLPAGRPHRNLFVAGHLHPADPAKPAAAGPLGLRVSVNGLQAVECLPLPEGDFNLGLDIPAALPDRPTTIELRLIGLPRLDPLDWLGRRLAWLPLPAGWRQALRHGRRRARCRRLRLAGIVADDERVFRFDSLSALAPRLLLPGAPAGLNIVGWLRGELGLGESARCMVRAADAARLPAALVELRLPCAARQGDATYAARLQPANPHPVNVVHFDPPVARDLAHHHGGDFFAAKYNIAYWAWELPEFPDAWVGAAAYVDEIWCPSEFVRRALLGKLHLPVEVMPHAIEFPLPVGDVRARFGLPADRCLFLFLYDLNSYQERKNPLAVIEAYRRAFPDEAGVGLVLKTQQPDRHPAAFAALRAALAGLRHARIIAETLPRADVHALEAACDVFVSLHRAEGFGLAVAEAMYLGKPVVSTDWSATAEFVTPENGCPVRCQLTTLRATHGPYTAGQTWADPDLDHAADWLRRLQADPALRARLGRAAAATMRRDYSPAAIGARYRARLTALGLR